MTLFWIIAAAMIIAALALLAPTLLRTHRARVDVNERLNVEIAREHLADLVKQKETGELSDEEFKQARADLEVALAEDLEGTAQPAPVARSGGRWALLASAVLIPAITIPVYLEIGSPQLIEGQPAVAATGGHGAGEMPPMEELVKQLRTRMEANPGNAEGWFLLGRTYMRLEDYPGAVYAFEKVVELLPEETAGLLSLADALTMRNGRQVGPRAVELLQKALSIDPNSVTALWLLGAAAADSGDNAQALTLWQRAYPLLSGEPGMQAELGSLITAAGGQLPDDNAGLPPIAMPTPAQTPASPAEATPADTGNDGAAITVEVALAPFLMENAAAEDTVFVLARAESGPPMPLAVARHRVDELPLRVTLTDAMAMMPAMRLSAFPRVKVSAKVSKSGQAGTQAGDLLARDVVVDQTADAGKVQLLIDRVAQ
ncbi:MAG: c-type cytochrome biogenesis protein CcmI [Gammaproteobacteria bacterium]|nr:c-type cytochrome biogenesis protein CcmI [Gammaproteobacteria bacterium]